MINWILYGGVDPLYFLIPGLLALASACHWRLKL